MMRCTRLLCPHQFCRSCDGVCAGDIHRDQRRARRLEAARRLAPSDARIHTMATREELFTKCVADSAL